MAKDEVDEPLGSEYRLLVEAYRACQRWAASWGCPRKKWNASPSCASSTIWNSNRPRSAMGDVVGLHVGGRSSQWAEAVALLDCFVATHHGAALLESAWSPRRDDGGGCS